MLFTETESSLPLNSNLFIQYRDPLQESAVTTIAFVDSRVADAMTLMAGLQADVKVFVVKYESQADLKVYKVKYESQAGDNNGKWFFTSFASKSKKKIFFVEYESQADVKIYFVDYESQAGWRNSAKRYLFY
jgi:hypothetical protein